MGGRLHRNTHREKDLDLGIGSDSVYFYIGYDLYNLVNEKKDAFRDYKQKVRQTISEYKKQL